MTSTRTCFRFLAPRFLLVLDRALDAEMVHARWQWVDVIKRALQHPGLNAALRLQNYLDNNPAYPFHQDMLPHIHADRSQHTQDLTVMYEEEQHIALGWRPQAIYMWQAQSFI